MPEGSYVGWPNALEDPGPPAPGRYCLAVCYCGDCPHYQPLLPVRRTVIETRTARPNSSWDTRDEPTWIDR